MARRTNLSIRHYYSNNCGRYSESSSEEDEDEGISPSYFMLTVPDQYMQIERRSILAIEALELPSVVKYKYIPFEYANQSYTKFMKKYCLTTKKILFLTTSPSMYGRCQTGIPMGDVKTVLNWMELDEVKVFKPSPECSKCPINGFKTVRTDVSGKHFWSFFNETCGSARNFFRNAFVHSFCPMTFLRAHGAHVSLSELGEKIQESIENICMKALADVVKLLQVEYVIAIGEHANEMALRTVEKEHLENTHVEIIPYPHANMIHNYKWCQKVHVILQSLDILKYFVPPLN